MVEIDYYDIVRQKMNLGPLLHPKHKKITALLKAFWNEEEIKILAQFETADKSITLKKLEEKTGIAKNDLKKVLSRSVKVGTLHKMGNKYALEPILPGIFEKYFQRRADTKENELLVAQLYRDLMKEVFPQSQFESDFKIFRPLLPLDAQEKLIEINEEYDVQAQAYPYETVLETVKNNDQFTVIPCQCRLIGELSGEPCEVAPAEMGCFVVGGAAGMMANLPGARVLNKEEAIEFLKETEKRGLVHNAIEDQGYESSQFFCNCCSCHCGALFPAKQFHIRGANPSNYAPKINEEVCTKCEICLKKCPEEAIFHRWPQESDKSDERIIVRDDLCIGCGICAANCPNNAIKMVKVRDNIPPEKRLIGNKTFTELLL
jgi:Pyruvate/2-oxoacid:ferredoxin oxidoreductase delta subunit